MYHDAHRTAQSQAQIIKKNTFKDPLVYDAQVPSAAGTMSMRAFNPIEYVLNWLAKINKNHSRKEKIHYTIKTVTCSSH